MIQLLDGVVRLPAVRSFQGGLGELLVVSLHVCVNSEIRQDQIRNSNSGVSDSHKSMIVSPYNTERR